MVRTRILTERNNAMPTAQNPRNDAPAQLTMPFPIASRMMTRSSFSTPTTTLAASTPTQMATIQIPAVGYLRHLVLEVTLTGTGGTTPAFTADAPFNAIQSIELRTAAGNNIIVPVTGYQLYLMNKYGSQFAQAPWSDPKANRQFSATAPSAHFFLVVPLEIDSETGLGAIPAMASNRSYQLNIIMSAVSTVLTGAPTVTAQVNATAHYWSEPPAQSPSGIAQATQPNALGTISQWQLDQAPLTPGDKYVKVNNVGNVMRTLIFTLRNNAGARIDASGWPAFSEIYIDNEPMFGYSQNEWEFMMTTWFGFDGATKDTVKALDTGVYVIPFHALAGGIAGDAANSRAQYLPTLDSSQLQIRGTSWGGASSTLEILTNSVIPTDFSAVFNK